jgi:hypothetical protein
MSAADGWTTVASRATNKPQKQAKQNTKLRRQQELAQAINAPSTDDDTNEFIEDQLVKRIVEQMVPALKESRFYHYLSELLHGNAFEVISVLGVGRLSSDASVLQTALAVALKDCVAVVRPEAQCVMCDPVLRAGDVRVLHRLGLQTDDINVKGKISCDIKTLFFMPHCPYRLYSNILWANWGEQLGNITILGNRYAGFIC